jgi:hypothetical protein
MKCAYARRMSEEDFTDLRAEFEGVPDTFLGDLFSTTWSHDRVMKLLRRMARACVVYSTRDEIPRWLGAGFWFLDTWPDCTLKGSPAFMRDFDPKYVSHVLEKFGLLADWLFNGDCPLKEGEAAFLREIDGVDAMQRTR